MKPAAELAPLRRKKNSASGPQENFCLPAVTARNG
jgi:hypothetical protein